MDLGKYTFSLNLKKQADSSIISISILNHLESKEYQLEINQKYID